MKEWPLAFNGATNPWNSDAKSFTGLSGDKPYMLRVAGHLEGGGSQAMLVRPNADADSGHYDGTGGHAYNPLGTVNEYQTALNTRTGLVIYPAQNAEGDFYAEALLWPKTGQNRMFLSLGINSTYYRDYNRNGIANSVMHWQNTVDAIASLEIAFESNCTFWGKVFLYQFNW